MTVVQEFPTEFPLIREYVSAMFAPSAPFEELGNEDVIISLKDGREFSFTAFALPNIQQLMQQDALEAFVSPGMLVVAKVTWASIFAAIEECLRLSVSGGYSLEHFGVLQKGSDERY